MMTNDYSAILQKYTKQLIQALRHLQYSYDKVSTLPNDLAILEEQQLEAWEGFMARFARVSDIFLNKYLRAKALYEDPAFSGTLRDLLNWAEKQQLIIDANIWLHIRELRNMQAHEYAEERLNYLVVSMLEKSPILLKLQELLYEA